METQNSERSLLWAIREVVSACMDRDMTLRGAEDTFRRMWMTERLSRVGNNQCAAAQIEGVHRNTIMRMLRKLGVETSGVGGPGVARRRETS